LPQDVNDKKIHQTFRWTVDVMKLQKESLQCCVSAIHSFVVFVMRMLKGVVNVLTLDFCCGHGISQRWKPAHVYSDGKRISVEL
jgi:hypothetical protein